MTTGEQLMATHPLNTPLYFQVVPDGVNGPPLLGYITERGEAWGLRYIRVECANGIVMEFTHAASWWGRLRLRLRAWKTQLTTR